MTVRPKDSGSDAGPANDSGGAQVGGLARVVGGLGITVYALGDILGAGIYALIGKVAGVAGTAIWASLLVAGLLAALTGLSYAELVSRFPVAAGAAAYGQRAFRRPLVSFLIGFLVLVSGLTSAATISRAFVGYLDTFATVPRHAGSLGLLALMSVLSYRGIRESTRVNFALTMVELGGLLLVIVAGALVWFGPAAPQPAPPAHPVTFDGIVAGATIAFFAYVGFEDTVNVAEEVRDAGRVIPRAIVWAITLASGVYLLVAFAALASVPIPVLATSDAPLLEVVRAAGIRLPGGAFSLIALIAIANTGLLNLIMASRMAYGMAREGLLPRALGRVHAVRQTPWVAVLAAFAAAAALASTGKVKLLAQTTSFLLLMVFTCVHLSLWVIKRRARAEPGEDGDQPPAFTTPIVIPILGVLTCGSMLFQYPPAVYLRALIVLLVGGALYGLARWRHR